MEPTKIQRIIGLDYFRVSLAILIFLFHSHIHVLKCNYGILNGFIYMGAIAMTGFFLLSGYTLNLTYKGMNNTQDIKKFFIKRLIAILPLYYTYGAINIIINIIKGGTDAAIEELILFPVEILGIQSVFATLFPFSHNGGSWFISCILICYFLFPLMHTLTNSLSNKQRILIIVLLGLIILWSPLVQRYFKLQEIYSNPFFRVLEFTIGMLLSQINIQQQTYNKFILYLRKPVICIATIICLIVGVSIAYYIGIPRDFMLFNWIALPCFMSLLISLGYLKFKHTKLIQYMSDLSFSIFLSQLSIVWFGVKYILEHIGYSSNFANIILSAIVCFLLANFFHYCIEKPSSIYLKAKFFK